MSGAIPPCSSAPQQLRALQERADGPAVERELVRSGRTRSATRVITPNAPSEPSTSWRSDGPAAVPGASSVASEPAGVTHSSATTCASMRPCPVEVWPAERVAAHPPTVAHS